MMTLPWIVASLYVVVLSDASPINVVMNANRVEDTRTSAEP
jgi:hypothetical protein